MGGQDQSNAPALGSPEDAADGTAELTEARRPILIPRAALRQLRLAHGQIQVWRSQESWRLAHLLMPSGVSVNV